jgi:ABC-type multidrug transport system fused ATPase/permease subunit
MTHGNGSRASIALTLIICQASAPGLIIAVGGVMRSRGLSLRRRTELPGERPSEDIVLLHTTLPYLRVALSSHKADIAVVVAGGFVAGSIATLKSYLESGIIQLVADIMASDSPRDMWNQPLEGFPFEDGGWIVTIPFGALTGRPLWIVVVSYILVALIGVGLALLTTRSRVRTARTMFASLYADGLDAAFVQGSPREAQYEPNEPGGLAGAIQSGARSVSGSYAFSIEAAQYLFALLTVVALLGRVSLEFSVFCLLLVLIFAMLSRWRARRLASDRETFDKQRRQLFGITDDVLSNREVLLAHEKATPYVEKLRRSADQLGSVDQSLAVREQAFSSAVGWLHDIGRVAILAVVLLALARGTGVAQVGDAYFYVALFARIMAPVQGLLHGYDDMRRSTASSRTLIDLLTRTLSHRGDAERLGGGAGPSTMEGRQQACPVQVDRAQPYIVFSDVCFRYDNTSNLIRNCTFNVPRGGVTLLLGRSGSGKTTLARLALGFERPDSGCIYVDGRSVSDWGHAELLEQMSYIAQTAHVIEGSVNENLFASDEVSNAEKAQSLVDVGLIKTPQEAPGFLSEQAKRLSEGQRQRIAIARLLIDEAPFVVLDEPMAGVDVFTHREVRSSLVAWLQDPNRTVLLISHRLAMASHADHVVILGDDGNVVEAGSPSELMQRSGRFADAVSVAAAELPGWLRATPLSEGEGHHIG